MTSSPGKTASGSPRILVVLSERERDLFFPGELGKRLSSHVPERAWIFPERLARPFGDLLRAENPNVLVGCWSLPPIDRDALDGCPALAYFCYLTGAPRTKMPRAFWERGGVASNWGNAISNTIAECALTLVLSCLRQVPRFHEEMHIDRSWRAPSSDLPRSLFNRRVGIHGFGNVARELVKLLAPFDVEIEAWSAPVPPAVFEQAGVKQAAGLRELFANNEILIDAEALTPASEGSVNESVIEALQPGAVFVNVGRGKIVDEAALARRAARGDISIGLDVYETEPLPADSPLRGLPNAVLLPHTAGPTVDRYPYCAIAALDNLEAFLAGKPLPQAFPLDMFDRST